MKTVHNLTLIFFLVTLTAQGQNELTQKEAMEDYTVLKNVLTKGHPGLYEYTASTEWDSLFLDFETRELPLVKNGNDLYKSLVKLTDHARDGHLIVMRPQMDSIPKLFPLIVKIINRKLYADTDDFEIPVGSEIISINGIPGTTLRNRLLKYAPSDGYNTTKKDRQIERELGILLLYELGALDSYQVRYKTPDNQTFSTSIESKPFASIGQRFSKRHSYFLQYHNPEDSTAYLNNLTARKGPFVHVLDSLNTAIVTMNSFGVDATQFASCMKTIFKKLRRKRVKHLILDLRQNEGGYPENAIRAYSYIARDRFKQRESTSVITSTLPEEAYSQNLINGYTYESFFQTYYQDATKQGNQWVLTNDENEPLMTPNKRRFKGKTYVLIGGRTFSAGSSFALFCKNQGVPLIGEETGGGYHTQTGGYPILYTLPNSKMQILMSFVQIKRYVEDDSIMKGSGVPPDVTVSLTIDDLRNGVDSQLDYVLQQIANESNTH